MTDPKFHIGDHVHIDGTSGVATVIFIEMVGRRYVYTVQYPQGLKKYAQETDLIKVG
jgi:hypothetical protein